MSQRYPDEQNHDNTNYIPHYDLINNRKPTLDHKLLATETTPESQRFNKQLDSVNRNSIQNVYVQNQGTSPYSKGLGSIQTSSGARHMRQSVEQNTELFIGHKKVKTPKNLGG